MVSIVDINHIIMTFYLTVSGAFLRSVLKQHILGVLPLPNPWTISSASRVLSEIHLPAINAVSCGKISSVQTLEVLSSMIFVGSL